MDADLQRAREVVVSAARREIDRLREVARGEPITSDELRATADRIEWALSVLERVDVTALNDHHEKG